MGKNRSVNGRYDFRLYVNCPECGRLILRSENTDNSEIPCSKCGAKVKVNVSIEDMDNDKIVENLSLEI